ncbi:PREDICTED: calcineurin-binding protein cabin-1-like [Priapulus caudatus]|uniref:Calcineurin-binding protein cabin-1-like n=1 Tax=Priapulus caudatus TaxID=37621 RepID=A0ABM1DS09_PRICU|nr:PREDICTED: calcineurin-binding protein cabin-1-like [Priapulus caudatus]
MLRIAALNETSNEEESDEELEVVREEALAQEVHAVYENALRFMRAGQIEDAQAAFIQLLESDFLQYVTEENIKRSDQEAIKLRLKYSVCKNLGSIASQQDMYESALEYYLQAVSLDSSDVILWFDTGQVALKLHDYTVARVTFEEGLQRNSSFWPCLENLILVLYALGDFTSCLCYIAQALEHDYTFLLGLVIKNKILEEDALLRRESFDWFRKCDQRVHEALPHSADVQEILEQAENFRKERRRQIVESKSQPMPESSLLKPLGSLTWQNLGQALADLYDFIMTNDQCNLNLACKVKLREEAPAGPNISTVTSVQAQEEQGVAEDKCEGTANTINEAAPAVGEKVTGKSCDADEKSNAGLEKGDSYSVPYASECEDSATDADNSAVASPVGTPGHKKPAARKRKGSERFPYHFVDDLGKRRSARVRKTVVQKQQEESIDYEELLTDLLPSTLLKECQQEIDSNMMEVQGEKSGKSEVFAGLKKDASIGSMENENTDVETFIQENVNNFGLVHLMADLLIALSAKAEEQWPDGLTQVYISVYDRVRLHVQNPPLFAEDTYLPSVKQMAMVSLLAMEFKVDAAIMEWKSVTTQPPSSSGPNKDDCLVNTLGEHFTRDFVHLHLLVGYTPALLEETLTYSIRFYWMKAWWNVSKDAVVDALDNLELAAEVLREASRERSPENPVVILLPNCKHSTKLHISELEQHLVDLEKSYSMKNLQALQDAGKYAEVVQLLMKSYSDQHYGIKALHKDAADKQRHLLLLQRALLKLEDYRQCVVCGERATDEALQAYVCAEEGEEKCGWAATIIDLLASLDSAIKAEKDCLSSLALSSRSRLAYNLIKLIGITMSTAEESVELLPISTVLPWMLLHSLIDYEERVGCRAEAEKERIKKSILLLQTTHEHCGRKGWCTHSEGALLLLFINVLNKELGQDKPAKKKSVRNELREMAEQCIYCLYGHPSKKSKARHLEDHGGKQLTLTWKRASSVFRFFRPEFLSEFDSIKSDTILPEVEELIKRILALIPSSVWNPASHIDEVVAYIDGTQEQLPQPPSNLSTDTEYILSNIFYMLADYYFKSNESGDAIKFYMHDICMNPDRFDSWAGMALAHSSRLEEKLYSAELKHDNSILKQAKSTLRCFQKALLNDSSNSSLWIENGSIAYQVQSYISCQLKLTHWGAKNRTSARALQDSRRKWLRTAETCYQGAQRCEATDERWLPHYMLGKIAEKQHAAPSAYLQHYKKAAEYLHETGATYPKKIHYYNPTYLAAEALEVYFRMHTSILKYLHRCAQGIDYNLLQTYITDAANSPFANRSEGMRGWMHEERVASSDSSDGIKEPQPPISSTRPVVSPTDDLTSDLLSSIMDVVAVVDHLVARTCNDGDWNDEFCVDDIVTQESRSIAVATDEHSAQETSDDVTFHTQTSVDERKILNEKTPVKEKITDEKKLASSTHVDRQNSRDDSVEGMRSLWNSIGGEKSPMTGSLSQKGVFCSQQSSVKEEQQTYNACSQLLQELVNKVCQGEIKGVSKRRGLHNHDRVRHIDLIRQCMHGLALCLSRFPHHYKSLYRLGYLYLHSPYVKNVRHSKDVLLGPDIGSSWQQLKHMPSPALFQERKHSNFFNGIWRIPVDEINRSGSFATHMYRSVMLLMAVLREQRDYSQMYSISVQLSRIPDPGKKYVRDVDREFLAEETFSVCIEIIRYVAGKMKGQDMRLIQTFLKDVYRIWMHGHKLPGANTKAVNSAFIKAYQLVRSDKITVNEIVLDQAVKFCQQISTRLAQQVAAGVGERRYSGYSSSSSNEHMPTTSSMHSPAAITNLASSWAQYIQRRASADVLYRTPAATASSFAPQKRKQSVLEPGEIPRPRQFTVVSPDIRNDTLPLKKRRLGGKERYAGETGETGYPGDGAQQASAGLIASIAEKLRAKQERTTTVESPQVAPPASARPSSAYMKAFCSFLGADNIEKQSISEAEQLRQIQQVYEQAAQSARTAQTAGMAQSARAAQSPARATQTMAQSLARAAPTMVQSPACAAQSIPQPPARAAQSIPQSLARAAQSTPAGESAPAARSSPASPFSHLKTAIEQQRSSEKQPRLGIFTPVLQKQRSVAGLAFGRAPPPAGKKPRTASTLVQTLPKHKAVADAKPASYYTVGKPMVVAESVPDGGGDDGDRGGVRPRRPAVAHVEHRRLVKPCSVKLDPQSVVKSFTKPSSAGGDGGKRALGAGSKDKRFARATDTGAGYPAVAARVPSQAAGVPRKSSVHAVELSSLSQSQISSRSSLSHRPAATHIDAAGGKLGGYHPSEAEANVRAMMQWSLLQAGKPTHTPSTLSTQISSQAVKEARMTSVYSSQRGQQAVKRRHTPSSQSSQMAMQAAKHGISSTLHSSQLALQAAKHGQSSASHSSQLALQTSMHGQPGKQGGKWEKWAGKQLDSLTANPSTSESRSMPQNTARTISSLASHITLQPGTSQAIKQSGYLSSKPAVSTLIRTYYSKSVQQPGKSAIQSKTIMSKTASATLQEVPGLKTVRATVHPTSQSQLRMPSSLTHEIIVLSSSNSSD